MHKRPLTIKHCSRFEPSTSTIQSAHSNKMTSINTNAETSLLSARGKSGVILLEKPYLNKPVWRSIKAERINLFRKHKRDVCETSVSFPDSVCYDRSTQYHAVMFRSCAWNWHRCDSEYWDAGYSHAHSLFYHIHCTCTWIPHKTLVVLCKSEHRAVMDWDCVKLAIVSDAWDTSIDCKWSSNAFCNQNWKALIKFTKSVIMGLPKLTSYW